MQPRPLARRSTLAILLLLPVLLGGCGSRDKAPANEATRAAAGGDAATAADAAVDLSPETLEGLVAPIALYQDVVLGHVLAASTNPQEVLDAGNWLLEHQDLSPGELNKQAEKLGLSPSMRALLQFPETVDMMCMKIDWTTQLGAAFTADQGAVLDAVQRMRAQAVEVGNLKSGEQLAVKTETTEGKEAIVIAPAKPEVIQVPSYDPVAVYAPPPATIPPPTTTVQTTTVVEEKGASTGEVIATGLLCFTAGVLVAEALDDDFYHYGPSWGYGGMYYGGHPYYPPPPYMYRPPYGGGYYPAHGYNHGGNYNHSFNNNTIIINDGDNSYWNQNDFGGGRGDGGRGDGGRGDAGRGNGGRGPSAGTSDRKVQSPLTKAKPGRSDLGTLNKEGQERTRRANEQRKSGTREGGQVAANDRAATRPGAGGAGTRATATTGAAGSRATTGAAAGAKAPAVKGTYAGASKGGAAAAKSAKSASAASKLPARSATSTASAAKKPSTDRGYAGATKGSYAGAAKGGGGAAASARPSTASRPTTASRPETSRPAATASRPEAAASRPAAATSASASRRSSGGGGSSAFSGGGGGSAERAASARGHASAGSSGGARASGGGARSGGRSR